jgi:hypothetical protein
MITQVIQNQNSHRLAPMQIRFVLRCKNTVYHASTQRRIGCIDYDSFNNCVRHNKQIGLFSSLIDRIKTQIPIGCLLNRSLR